MDALSIISLTTACVDASFCRLHEEEGERQQCGVNKADAVSENSPPGQTVWFTREEGHWKVLY